jgi:hypothetical protein
MIGMFATACPAGWTLCDGSGACPNLNGAYIKGGSAFAALSGSNAHTHSVAAFATGVAGGHTPTATGTFTTSAVPDHKHYTEFDDSGSNALLGHFSQGIPVWTSTHRMSFSYTGVGDVSYSSTAGIDSSVAGAHSHTVSVTMNAVADHSHAIPAFDVPTANHEPAHAILVMCMKN